MRNDVKVVWNCRLLCLFSMGQLWFFLKKIIIIMVATLQNRRSKTQQKSSVGVISDQIYLRSVCHFARFRQEILPRGLSTFRHNVVLRANRKLSSHTANHSRSHCVLLQYTQHTLHLSVLWEETNVSHVHISRIFFPLIDNT